MTKGKLKQETYKSGGLTGLTPGFLTQEGVVGVAFSVTCMSCDGEEGPVESKPLSVLK